MNPLRYLHLTLFFTLGSIGTPVWLSSQTRTLTLDECYLLAREHYPQTRQMDLIRQSESYTLDNISKGRLPQVGLYAQASYQSDVTQVPISIPGMDIPVISKDQYRLYAEATQTLYDGGVNRQQQQLHQVQARAEEEKTEADLYKLHERIQQLYFSILLLDEQQTQIKLVKKDIELGLRKVKAAITYGTALKSNEAVLRAELLNVQQREMETISNRKAFVQMLGYMTGLDPVDSIRLVRPPSVLPDFDIRRPELRWFEAQQQTLNAQEQLLTAKNRPKVSLFVQAGIGRPALNMLDNDIKGYYIGGLRAAWPLSAFYTLKNEKDLLHLQSRAIDVQRETFLFNTRLQQQQQQEAITRWEALLATDEEIIALRESIKETALAQMELGVITSHDYLREVNAADQARQNQIIHAIQLLMARHSLQYITGQKS